MICHIVSFLTKNDFLKERLIFWFCVFLSQKGGLITVSKLHKSPYNVCGSCYFLLFQFFYFLLNSSFCIWAFFKAGLWLFTYHLCILFIDYWPILNLYRFNHYILNDISHIIKNKAHLSSISYVPKKYW